MDKETRQELAKLKETQRLTLDAIAKVKGSVDQLALIAEELDKRIQLIERQLQGGDNDNN